MKGESKTLLVESDQQTGKRALSCYIHEIPPIGGVPIHAQKPFLKVKYM